MSLLLDQRLVGEVAEFCPAQFMAYYTCLGNGDAQACFEEQKTLSKCAKTAPSFVKIINKCQDKMDSYEQCIRANPDFRTKCFEQLSDMRKCTVEALEK